MAVAVALPMLHVACIGLCTVLSRYALVVFIYGRLVSRTVNKDFTSAAAHADETFFVLITGVDSDLIGKLNCIFRNFGSWASEFGFLTRTESERPWVAVQKDPHSRDGREVISS